MCRGRRCLVWSEHKVHYAPTSVDHLMVCNWHWQWSISYLFLFCFFILVNEKQKMETYLLKCESIAMDLWAPPGKWQHCVLHCCAIYSSTGSWKIQRFHHSWLYSRTLLKEQVKSRMWTPAHRQKRNMGYERDWSRYSNEVRTKQ